MADDRQAFCGNEQCRVITWDLTRDPAQFKANARLIDPNAYDPEAAA